MDVVEVYSNSSSAPKRASSTVLRAPSLTTSATTAPTSGDQQDQLAEAALARPASASRSEASQQLSAAFRTPSGPSCPLATALTGPLPLPVARQ